MRDGIHVAFGPIGCCNALSEGQLRFPTAPVGYGLYRIEFEVAGRVAVYIGETSNFRGRFRRYERPGITSSTNTRVHSNAVGTLKGGGRVTVAVAHLACAAMGGVQRPLDLNDPNVRRAVEYSEVDRELLQGAAVLNKRTYGLRRSVNFSALRLSGAPPARG